MRQLTEHKVGGLNEDLEIYVTDQSDPGNACHTYNIAYDLNPGTDAGGASSLCLIKFQNGSVKEAGVNGITQEALLAIVIDRLQGFQSGTFACRENAIALTKLQEAMHWLHHRTKKVRINGETTKSLQLVNDFGVKAGLQGMHI
jgi:hypothetical protein